MNVVDIYRLLAPVYDRSRPLWARGIMGRAEAYLEHETLPRLVKPETHILDLGSGTGVNLDRLRRLGLPFASYVGLDLSPTMLARAQAKLEDRTRAAYCRGDIWRLPFSDHSFDLVLSTWALSHMWPPQKVFDEVTRVLKPKGAMFALFWSRPQSPMGVVADVLERPMQVRFVEVADLERSLGDQATTRRFAAGWGSSITFRPSSVMDQSDRERMVDR